jgi:hypothetical protein
MLYSEIIAVCSQIHTKHINTLCGLNVQFVNVKPDGTNCYHWAVNTLLCVAISIHTQYSIDFLNLDARHFYLPLSPILIPLFRHFVTACDRDESTRVASCLPPLSCFTLTTRSPVKLFLSLNECEWFLALWLTSLIQLLNAYGADCSETERFLLSMLVDTRLYFYYRYFGSSWNQTDLLHSADPNFDVRDN